MAVTKKRLNKRVVAILTITLMVLMAILAGIMIWATSKKDPTIYAKRGEKFLAAGQYKEAVRAYQRAFRYSNKDPKWLVKIAEVYYQMGEVGRALGTLQNAVIMDPTFIKAQNRLLEIFYEIYGRNAPPSAMRRFEDEAQKLIDMIPERKLTSDPKLKKILAFAYHCRGIARYGRRAESASLESEAIDDIKKALELDPQPEYVESLALISLGKARQLARLATVPDISVEAYNEYLQEMRKDIAKAQQLYQSLLKKRSQQSATLVSVGNFYQNKWGALEGALASFCKLQVQSKTSRIKFLQLQLDAINANKKLSPAQKQQARMKIIKEISQLTREVPLWKKEVDKHKKQQDICNSKAQKFYEQALKFAKSKKDKVQALLAMSVFKLNHNQLDEAEKLAKQAIKIDPESYIPYQLTVQILRAKSGKVSKKERTALLDNAIKLLEHRINDLPHIFAGPTGRKHRLLRAQLQASLAELYLDRGIKKDLKEIKKIIDSLSQEVGDSPLVYQLKARYALAQGNLIAAIQDMEKADNISNGKSARIKLSLAKLYYQKGELGAARDAIEATLKLNPAFTPALQLAGTIYLRLGQVDKALAAAEKILVNNENNIPALALKLECLVRIGDMNQADAIAAKLKKLGTKLAWKLQKARIFLVRGEYDKAKVLLKEFLKNNAGHKLASVYLIEIYSRENNLNQAKKILSDALKKNPNDEGLKRIQELLSINDKNKRFARLREMQSQLLQESMAKSLKSAKEEKDPFRRAVRMFDQYVKRNDLQKAKKYLDKAIKIDPKRANALAFKFAIVTGNWKQAEKCVELARRENLDGVKGLFYQARYENARGWDFLNKKNPKQAREFFGKSVTTLEELIAQLPKDSTAHALLAEGYFWTDRKDEATAQVSKALELSPNNPYAMRAESVLQWFDLIKMASPPADLVQSFTRNIISGLRSLPYDKWFKSKRQWISQQIERQKEFQEDITGDIHKVLARREKIRKEHPEDIANLLRLAWIYENRKEVKNIDKAEDFYRQALREKQTSDILQAYWNFAVREKRIDKMEKFLTDFAAELAKKNDGDAYSLLGYFYMLRRDIPKAESAFLKAVKIEDTADKRLDVATFYNRFGNYPKVAQWARKALNGKLSKIRERQARTLLINALLATSQWSKAQAQIDEYKKLYPNDVQGTLYQAQLLMGQDKLGEALGILNQVIDKHPDNLQALGLRSIVNINMWQIEEAKNDIEAIQRVNPQAFNPDIQIRLIKLYCELGRATEADQLARTLVQKISNQPNLMNIFRRNALPALASALEPRDYEELLAWCSSLQNNSWIWSLERGRYWMMQRKYNQAQGAFATAWDMIQKAPVNIRIYVLNQYMESLFRAKLYDKLINVAEKAIPELKQQSTLLLSWQAAGYYAQGNKSKGISLFLSAMKSVQNPIEVWQRLHNTFMLAADAKDIIKTLQKVLQNDKNNASLKLILASCYIATGEDQKGKDICIQLSNQQKNKQRKATYLYLLGQEFTNKYKYKQAADILKQALQLSPDNPIFLNNYAYIVAEYLNNPQQAEQEMKKVISKLPDNPDILDTYGQVLAKLGKKQQAMRYLASSVWIRESAASRYHLALLLLDEGRKADAEIQLNRALKLVGNDKKLEQRIRDAMLKL